MSTELIGTDTGGEGESLFELLLVINLLQLQRETIFEVFFKEQDFYFLLN
jgi:hypothetical protein